MVGTEQLLGCAGSALCWFGFLFLLFITNSLERPRGAPVGSEWGLAHQRLPKVGFPGAACARCAVLLLPWHGEPSWPGPWVLVQAGHGRGQRWESTNGGAAALARSGINAGRAVRKGHSPAEPM